jgi:hypothetical protein
MGELVDGKYGGKINRWQKGESGNPNGRPKKVVLSLKKEGYKLAEINDTIQLLCSMTLEELKKVWDNPKTTALEKTIIAALRKGIEKGQLVNVETLLNRVYGKPKESVDITTAGEQINSPKVIVEIINGSTETKDENTNN